jgi:hypothetical protein
MLELELDIPEHRELRVTLPDDCPVGRVKAVISPLPDVASPAKENLRMDNKEFLNMLPSLLQTHRGQFVAIHQGKVLAAGKSSVEVLTQAERNSPGAYPSVHFVTEELPRLERLPSLRMPRG